MTQEKGKKKINMGKNTSNMGMNDSDHSSGDTMNFDCVYIVAEKRKKEKKQRERDWPTAENTNGKTREHFREFDFTLL